MARTTDRQFVSEAIRTQERKLWRIDDRSLHHVILVTDFDERLTVIYGLKGQISRANYMHWDRDTGEIVSKEQITQGKRRRVLHLIGASK